MTASDWYTALEVAQAVASSIGLVVALGEWRSVWGLNTAWLTPSQRILARHAMLIEALRCSVHLAILTTAGLSLWLPAPPAYAMPTWITQALVARKGAVLWIAVVCCVGTLSARRARLRAAAARHGL